MRDEFEGRPSYDRHADRRHQLDQVNTRLREIEDEMGVAAAERDELLGALPPGTSSVEVVTLEGVIQRLEAERETLTARARSLARRRRP